jgi:hypothetical protein
MKNKMIIAALVLMLFGAGSVFAQGFDLGDLQEDMNAFSAEMAKTLPFNSTLGLNWADAHIGNFPHFGAGLFGGLSFMDESTANNLLGNFGAALPSVLSFMPLPAAGAEARLGGFILPFDIGLKFGWLPPISFSDNINVDYLMIGADIRYAIMKGNILLPKIVLGVGYNYTKGGIASSMDASETYTIGSKSITVSDPELNLDWSSSVIDMKLQVSKELFIITPSVGVGATYSWSEAGYTVKAETSGDLNDINAELESAGLPPIDLNNNGFSSVLKNSGWGVRLFAGLGFNFLLIKVDVTGMYDIQSEIWNAGVGLRLQI